MLIDWKDLGIENNISRLLHVGGHLAEEAEIYDDRVDEVVWIEADIDRAREIKNLTGDEVICAVVGDANREVTFHEANNGQSSSILELGTHKQVHPEVEYISERTVQMYPLSTVIESLDLGSFEMLNLDIQGAELMALKGLGDHIDSVNYIYTEVNRKKLYKDCCLIGEIDSFLFSHGFQRAKVVWTDFGWGDAFYVRKN